MAIFGAAPKTILIAILALALVAVLVYVVRSRLTDGGGSDDREHGGAENRIEQQRQQRQDGHIPLRTRVSGMTGPTKWMLGGLLLIAVVVAWNVYSYYKTGSPTQVFYAQETQVAIASAIGLAGGIAGERKRRKKEGVVDVLHEATPEEGTSGTTVQRFYYHAEDTVTDDNGLVVHEYAKSRVLGLFRQPMRVGDDRRLRNDEDVHRPLTDKVAHRIPDHAIEAGDNHYVFYTKGSRTTKSPTAVADYEYRPPYNLSQEQYARIVSDVEQMETEVREKRSMLAFKNKKIRRLEQALENSLSEDWEDFIEVVERLAPVIGSTSSRQEILKQLPEGAFQSHSQRGGENGSQNGQYGRGDTAAQHGGRQ